MRSYTVIPVDKFIKRRELVSIQLIEIKPLLYLTIGLRVIYSYSYGFSSIALYILFEFTVPVSFLIRTMSSICVDARIASGFRRAKSA